MGEKDEANRRARRLGIYDLFLATGAILIGVQMVSSSSGIFAEDYPDSWVMPGVLAIVIFGLGNIIAAVFSFKKRHNSSWYASAIMEAVFFFS